ncbi:hypothetical protein BTO06_02500 [Tenacibaculum sp. SZ-18]|uniref:hypothetical protein n=1 Tax=Tenacibaculum sp. SZ-18 TaxID=754423 RepID=UPI000C2D4E91|nr:hypothetical protein [Tenacibaculum sp. SZ-18]AUC14098.1 hypothetical protein BTO06_02500 [Tenacibaculum sp. SZ-18]
MKRSKEILVIIIGVLAILASVYGVYSDKDLTDAFSGIFIGICLIIAVFLKRKRNNTHKES